MKLDTLYSLRNEFVIIGLTGRVGGGCSQIAKLLANERFIDQIDDKSKAELPLPEQLKNKICYNFLSHSNNWKPFQIINYKNVLLLHLLNFSIQNIKDIEVEFETIQKQFIDVICQNGKSKAHGGQFRNRFDSQEDGPLWDLINSILIKNVKLFEVFKDLIKEGNDLNDNLKRKDNSIRLYDFFFSENYKNFCNEIFEALNICNITKRTRFTHDLANNLRNSGQVIHSTSSPEHIYTVAETLNRLIKSWRNNVKPDGCRIVIDALKNSLELMYFKEKYSGFYMIATNKDDDERRIYVKDIITKNDKLKHIAESIKLECAKNILDLDDAEYKCNDFKKGEFSTPDIENCIQKSDYHIFIENKSEPKKKYLDINHQVLRLTALIKHPGIITPSAIERTMQIAFNAKLSSGCISRQVGAVITDKSFSVKAIGWNDVPSGQTPCNLRDIRNLRDEKNDNLFSDYEKGDFKLKVLNKLPDQFEDNLEGKPCSFCFKSFQNAIEGEKNQVHTRSLHAEENAMMQITKYGGQALRGGYLFTTASPCELCSKKAFQLGIENIYYIDPYPGIATTHILKGGNDKDDNPNLIMFQGATGRGYNKLYEPFMPYKDELTIITKINPKASVDLTIDNLISDKKLKERLIEVLNGKSEDEKKQFLERSLGISIEKFNK
ncbi:MAG TPA: hypothetical protein VL125_00065 [Pelobium sp.]|nr:hypothetical protein [Pelobium sp.]